MCVMLIIVVFNYFECMLFICDEIFSSLMRIIMIWRYASNTHSAMYTININHVIMSEQSFICCKSVD